MATADDLKIEISIFQELTFKERYLLLLQVLI